ncbi:3-oxoacyl-[acyl-carrier-protein] synthase III C-terminal domain-containing protein [Loktanella sp. Alg231-35]|uniref:3-oxoacyl-[acyl-carrier-protein] synthase III C-terminal domain-containing protein n=1 Tax=Loktanella sp. Alg231-35 TaxID=1922220 RepID=UPI000D54C691|nr:3-oxoacyl-[acyl-carrier-protein] synthase III C-terminal domain-containing protein [Loktanella sp. Alg231-35]
MKIAGIGTALPKRRDTSAALDRQLGLVAGRIAALTGVQTRYVCSGEESQITLGTAAAQAALSDAGLLPRDIDLIISAAAVPYQLIPATAPAYQAALGIPDGAAFGFDVNATCLGFVTALEACAGMLASGRFKRALIISSEVASRGLPWDSKPAVAGLFGDGAAAAVVEDSDAPFVTRFRSYPSGYDICKIGAGGTRYDFRAEPEAFAANTFFDMDGKALFRLTSKYFGGFVDDLLADAGWTKAEVDLIVPHQASPMALQHMIRHCGFDAGKVVDICADYGNQIAASIPFALGHARDRLQTGRKVLLLGTSAGVSFGGAAVTF